MEHAKHLIRAFLLVILVFACVEITRQALQPESFGELGHFRADALPELRNREINYDNKEKCAADGCHADVMESNQEDKHSTIDCQICHAPLGEHDGTDETPDMTVNRSKDLCLRCHQYLPARPTQHPQIDLAEHMETQEFEESDGDEMCVECHTPHEPGI